MSNLHPTCTDCNGEGTFTFKGEPTECGTCRGTGSASADCDYCEGYGTLEIETDGVTDFEVCGECVGTGIIQY